jgi:hypothetical protein
MSPEEREAELAKTPIPNRAEYKRDVTERGLESGYVVESVKEALNNAAAGRHSGRGVIFDDSRWRDSGFSRQNFKFDRKQCLDVRASFYLQGSVRVLTAGLARAGSF